MTIRGWKWAELSTGVNGVDLYDDHLLWYSEYWPLMSVSGGAAIQSFEEFLVNGAVDGSAPPEILAEIRVAVLDRLGRAGT